MKWRVDRRPKDSSRFYRRASKIRLNGVSVARLKRPQPADANTSLSWASVASGPSAGPSPANELLVQTRTEAAEKTLPSGLKLSSAAAPAIGSPRLRIPSGGGAS